MKEIFGIPRSMSDAVVPYCPGCGHGIALRLIGEVIDELGMFERIVGIAPVGCAVRCWRLYRFDMMHAAHGRPPAVATGLKRALPNNIIFTYQGDGDSAAIGLAELVHAALRCEKFSVFMINNAIYKSNLFLMSGAVGRAAGSDEIEDMGGLARLLPITFTCGAISALAIAG